VKEGSDMGETILIYRNSRGVIKLKKLKILSDEPGYLSGHCEGRYRTFRKDHILEFIEDSNQIDERLSYHIKNNTEPPPSSSDLISHLAKVMHLHYRLINSPEYKYDSPEPPQRLEICFTGFKGEDKKRLETLATSNNLLVRPRITRNLYFLCCGFRTEPSKIRGDLDQGVTLIDEDQFLKFLKTGELPEEQ
jgi:hypothetical protein